jgi:acetolactate synthase-1/2/3 large subunit
MESFAVDSESPAGQRVNGADVVCDALLANGVDTWFANPGTSEMHLVAALDRRPEVRCVLGLFEGVVTGAADGYARMKGTPAATLLHCGPGLTNGLANLHNARRGHTPIVNIIGDHASYHLALDAPLTTDIESLARPMSQWVGRSRSADSVAADIGEAYREAMTQPGVASLIMPADIAWTETRAAPIKPERYSLKTPSSEAVTAAARALTSGKRVSLMVGGDALHGEALAMAAGICAKTGARLMAPVATGRVERGANAPPVTHVPYFIDGALKVLEQDEVFICVGPSEPVAFFAYPGKPGRLLPPGCEVIQLAQFGENLGEALSAVADLVGAKPARNGRAVQRPDLPMSGPLTGAAIGAVAAHYLPEQAIVCNEALTQAYEFNPLTVNGAPHDMLQLTGGAIGIGIPLSVGAAIACPDRKVVLLQADGSGMYTCQGLWTQARERLDVVTIILANRTYDTLHREMRNVGATEAGENARRMLNLDDPALDWVAIANGMGVEAARADTAERFAALMKTAVSRPGPFLIEAVI